MARRTEDSATCPRCGYDQRGVIAQWTDSCPLATICSECGLSIDWIEHFNAWKKPPRWCVEAAETRRQICWRTLRTMAVVWLPWRFWKQLWMSHEIRWRRLVQMVLVLTMLLYGVYAIVGAAAVLIDLQQMRTMPRARIDAPSDWILAAMPALAPFSDESPGRAIVPGGVIPLMTPNDVAAAAWVGWWPKIAAIALINFFAALAFAALPVSRRRAKVRWAHIWRIAVYFLPLTIPMQVAGIAAAGSPQWSRQYLGFDFEVISALLFVATFLMMIPWWSLATGRYLRMPHAWAVGLLAVIIGLLTMMLLAAVLSILMYSP